MPSVTCTMVRVATFLLLPTDPRSAVKQETQMAAQGRAKSAPGNRRFGLVRPHLAAVHDRDPGEKILRFDGRSGRLSPSARPEGGSVTSAGAAPVLTVESVAVWDHCHRPDAVL